MKVVSLLIKTFILCLYFMVSYAVDPKPEDGTATCDEGWHLVQREPTPGNTYVKYWCLNSITSKYPILPQDGHKICQKENSYLTAPSGYADIEKILSFTRRGFLKLGLHFRRSLTIDGTAKCENNDCRDISPDNWQTEISEIEKLYDYGEPNHFSIIHEGKSYSEKCLNLKLLNGRLNDFFCDSKVIPGTQIGENENVESYGALCGRYAKVEW